MKNVTITLPEDVARRLRVKAAEDDRSVSRWIAELLERMRYREDEYELVMRRALSIEPPPDQMARWPQTDARAAVRPARPSLTRMFSSTGTTLRTSPSKRWPMLGTGFSGADAKAA